MDNNKLNIGEVSLKQKQEQNNPTESFGNMKEAMKHNNADISSDFEHKLEASNHDYFSNVDINKESFLQGLLSNTKALIFLILGFGVPVLILILLALI